MLCSVMNPSFRRVPQRFPITICRAHSGRYADPEIVLFRHLWHHVAFKANCPQDDRPGPRPVGVFYQIIGAKESLRATGGLFCDKRLKHKDNRIKGRNVTADRQPATVDAVVIGRNEGARLLACLASLAGQVRRVVYVDSGSTDGSAKAAAAVPGVQVVALDMARPFTAARARNAGLARLQGDAPDFVQMVDGDCAVDPGWIARALAGFAQHPKAAVICGRRRERHPQASVWNRMIDREWDTPVGQARACGGDALFRFAPLMALGGYREDLIAGEEPELCLRLGRLGHEIWRIDAEMTLHDAAMTKAAQWWRRAVRAGHAFAEGAALHGSGPERHWRVETARALIWGAALPLGLVLAALLISSWALAGFALYPLQIARILARDPARDLATAAFTVIAKFAEARGALGYYLNRLRGRKRGLIEYK